MAVRKFKPTTPGQRHKIIGTFEEITAKVPEKSLVYGKSLQVVVIMSVK
jgi:large subunit ribosomal protein L2